MEITKETQHKAIAALRQCAKENENKPADTGAVRVTDLCRDVADYLEKLEADEHPAKETIANIRNSVWHDIAEKPDLSKFVVFSDGEETMTPPLRNILNDYPMLIEVANKKYGGGYKMWAYRDDLLPNKKEEE